MTIEKLERVMWRIRKYADGRDYISNTMIRKAIMFECGTSPSTIRDNRKAMKALGWIRARNKRSMYITDKDIEGTT